MNLDKGKFIDPIVFLLWNFLLQWVEKWEFKLKN